LKRHFRQHRSQNWHFSTWLRKWQLGIPGMNIKESSVDGEIYGLTLWQIFALKP